MNCKATKRLILCMCVYVYVCGVQVWSQRLSMVDGGVYRVRPSDTKRASPMTDRTSMRRIHCPSTSIMKSPMDLNQIQHQKVGLQFKIYSLNDGSP